MKIFGTARGDETARGDVFLFLTRVSIDSLPPVDNVYHVIGHFYRVSSSLKALCVDQ